VSLILNIDTAVQSASLCVARNGRSLALRTNPEQRDHAAWLHVTLGEMLAELGLGLADLDAVAISAGPGSYTGLRVGMSTAKGFCYALQIPLIIINTLELMAATADAGDAELLCPMIDARRMEVFTAVYDRQLQTVLAPTNMILDADSFRDLRSKRMLFFGNGSGKFETVMQGPPATFAQVTATAADMAPLAQKKFEARDFGDLAYAEPYYGKDFHSPA